MRIVELSGYPPMGGCAPCAMGMGAIEIIPPTIQNGDEPEAPSEVVPMRAVTTALVVGAVLVTATAVGLWWLARKR